MTGSCRGSSSNAAAIGAISVCDKPLDENLKKSFKNAHTVIKDRPDMKAQTTRVGGTLEKQEHRSEMTSKTAVKLKARQENANARYAKICLREMKSSYLDNADAVGCERFADERLEEALLVRPFIYREKVQCDEGIGEWSRPIPQLAEPRVCAGRKSGCSTSADEQLRSKKDATDSRSTRTPEDKTKKASNPARSNVARQDLVAITQSDMQQAEIDNVRDTGVRDHLRNATASETKTHSHLTSGGNDTRASSRLNNADIEREATLPRIKLPKFRDRQSVIWTEANSNDTSNE